jgi:hypothetical protein
MALSKFGTFSGIRGTTSSATDVNASTPTFSFYNSTYTSKYLSFVGVETTTNQPDSANKFYYPLQTPTNQEQALMTTWEVPPYIPSSEYQAGTTPIPFVYIAGKYVLTGPQYDASPIAGMYYNTAIAYMTNGKDSTSQNLEAAAGYLVANLCTLTNHQPTSVCSLVPAKLRKGVSATISTTPPSTTTTAPRATSTTVASKTSTTVSAKTTTTKKA